MASFLVVDELTRQLKQTAFELGFSRVGVCPAGPSTQFDYFQEWVRRGYAGEMHYIEGRLAAYAHPDHVMAGVRSLVMLAVDYHTTTPRALGSGVPQGRVARYAWGEVDYHDWIHVRLRTLSHHLRLWCPESRARGVVDTAPLPEREFARLAGLGWVGKNTLLIHPQAGSWCFLAALLTDVELTYDLPFEHDHCGTCTACLEACPTQAFPQPYVLDATRCISYMTIELRGLAPESLRDSVAPWVFGCDVCQEVCPWNRFAVASDIPEFQAHSAHDPLLLCPLFYWTDDDFRAHFRQTPLWRSKRRGILRNAALALGTTSARAAVVALIRGLDDCEPIVRSACAWSLGRLHNQSNVIRALRRRWWKEREPHVRHEIEVALQSMAAKPWSSQAKSRAALP